MSSIKYSLTFEYRPEYLHAELEADIINLDIAIAYINELISELRSSAAKRVLFQRKTPTVLARTDYSMIVNIIANQLPKDVSFAVVDRSPTPYLVQNVIRDQREGDHPNINAFDSVYEAEAWLIAQE